jgi:8-oxo-dGTP diphosphatase
MQFRRGMRGATGGGMAGFHGAKAGIIVGGRLLTVLRDDIAGIAWPGWWDLPGGGREAAETPQETVLREIREEVGLVIAPGLLEWGRAFRSDAPAETVSWFFGIRLDAGREAEIVLGDEGQEWRLVDVGEFLDNPRAIPFLKERLQIWLQETRGRL